MFLIHFVDDHIWVKTEEPGGAVVYDNLYMSKLDQPFFIFNVMCESDVHVALSNMHGNIKIQTYEMIIGARGDQYVEFWRVSIHYMCSYILLVHSLKE